MDSLTTMTRVQLLALLVILISCGGQKQEPTERTIIYSGQVSSEEIASWHIRLDSIYGIAKERNKLIATLDTSIEGNYSRLKQLNDHLNEKYDDVKATEAVVKVLVDSFNVRYGEENLSPELSVVKNKLRILQVITLRESSLWYEARIYMPLLISGKKSVKDLQEPFSDRYTLTYSLELIDDIRELERKYEATDAKR
jgi:hypothetical protein